MPYVFISYVRENSEPVENLIRSRLEDAGIEVWIDTHNIQPGEDWEQAVRKGLEGAARCLVCFSHERNVKARSPVNDELRLAVDESRKRQLDRRWIIPILLSPCDIPEIEIAAGKRLDRLERIDLGRNEEAGMDRLLAELEPLTMPPPIVVLGSGNGDFVLTHSVPISMGTKNFVDSEQLLGGSGLNASARLLAAGFNTTPILSVGPDRLGEMVRDHLVDSAAGADNRSLSTAFLNDESFFSAEIKTPQSTIVVDGDRRTIFAEKLTGGRHYFSHVLARLEKILTRGPGEVAAVLIGHIHTDGRFRPDGSERDEERWGECTRYLIGRFAGQCPIFLNFGRNQIDLGVDFWEPQLARATLVQLNLDEAKSFFAGKPESGSSPAIFRWFLQRGISLALTFGKFGAAATYRDGDKGGVLAWRIIRPDEVKDTTGAGDAFAAGVVSALQGKLDFSFPEFLEAIETARAWAGYACRHKGASINPPGRGELEEFVQSRKELVKKGEIRIVQILDLEEFFKVLETIDTAFSD